MFAAQPATITGDLLDRIYRFITRGGCTPFDLRRIEADVQALENASKGDAYMARAALCALKWDEKGARTWADRACTIDGSAVVAFNNAVSMRHMNRPDWAVEYAEMAVRRAPAVREMTVLLVEQLAADGRLRSGREALRDLERRVGEAVELDFRVDTFAQIADEQGISDARLQAELRAAMRVLAAERVRYEGIVFSAGADPDGGATFTVLINIQGNLRDEMRLEAKLGEVLADFPEWNPCELSVEFQRAASQDARQPA